MPEPEWTDLGGLLGWDVTERERGEVVDLPGVGEVELAPGTPRPPAVLPALARRTVEVAVPLADGSSELLAALKGSGPPVFLIDDGQEHTCTVTVEPSRVTAACSCGGWDAFWLGRSERVTLAIAATWREHRDRSESSGR